MPDSAPASAAPRDRRGSALLLVLVLSVALAALALSAILLSGHSSLVTRAFDRERDYRYATEAALALGRARLSEDAAIVLNDGEATPILQDTVVRDALGRVIPGVRLNAWVARTGSMTGEHGLYASIIAEARDEHGGGAKFVRRLELMEENFARFLDWSDRWVRQGCYGAGEVMDGPVFSNTDICDIGAHFKDTVATAGQFTRANGRYDMGRLSRQPRMDLPSTARLGRLEAYASSGNLRLDAPTNGAPTTARLRIEFVWLDLNGDGDAAGPEDRSEGFMRVYRAAAANRNRADYRASTDDHVKDSQCGDWHWLDGELAFFPVSVHREPWFRAKMLQPANRAANRGDTRLSYWSWGDDALGTAAIEAHTENHASSTDRAAQRTAIMRGSRLAGSKVATDLTPRCFPAGDPHLAAAERHPSLHPAAAAREVGGTDTTFTPLTGASGSDGEWLPWTGTPVDWGAFANAGSVPSHMRPYLWPLDRGLNPGTKGVIYVDGTVAVHGTLRGRVTLYAAGDVVFVDDLEYSVDPSSDNCEDMFGVIAARSITIADNGINTPQDPANGGDDGNTWMDDNTEFRLHGVLMALDSFYPERYGEGPGNMSTCNGYPIGRGCLNQVGGAIVARREVTYESASTQGYMEYRTYDRRMTRDSPPYFPTTGRYFDNRFYEVDPLNFSIVAYLERIGQSGS